MAFSRPLPWNRSPSFRPWLCQRRAAARIPRCTTRPSRLAWTHVRSFGQACGSAGRDSQISWSSSLRRQANARSSRRTAAASFSCRPSRNSAHRARRTISRPSSVTVTSRRNTSGARSRSAGPSPAYTSSARAPSVGSAAGTRTWAPASLPAASNSGVSRPSSPPTRASSRSLADGLASGSLASEAATNGRRRSGSMSSWGWTESTRCMTPPGLSARNGSAPVAAKTMIPPQANTSAGMPARPPMKISGAM